MTDQVATQRTDQELQVMQAAEFLSGVDFKDADDVKRNKNGMFAHILVLATHCGKSIAGPSSHVLDLTLATLAKNGHKDVLEELHKDVVPKFELHPVMTGTIAEYYNKSQNPNSRYDIFAYDLDRNSNFQSLMRELKENKELTYDERLYIQKALVNVYARNDNDMIEAVNKFQSKLVPAA